MHRLTLAAALLALVLLGVVFVTREVGPGSSSGGSDDSSESGPQDPALSRPGDRPTARASGSPADADLDPATSIRGTVRDAAGEPIVSARLTVHAIDPSGRVEGRVHLAEFDKALAEATSRWDGTFVVPAEPGKPFLVAAARDGYVPSARRATVGGACPVTLHPAETDLVRIVDVAGAPIEGAIVYCQTGGRDWIAVPALLATSDADGRARTPVPPDGSLVVRAKGYASTWFERDDLDEDQGEATVVLDDGSVLAGVVVDGTGAPISGAVVFVGEGDHEYVAIEHRIATDAYGAFRFEGLSPRESAHLRASHPRLGNTRLRVVPGETGLRVVLRRPGSVRGVVVHEDGSPAGGAEFPDHVAGCGPDGVFEVPFVAPGPQRISARWPRRPASHAGSAVVDVPEGGTVEGVRIVVMPERRRSRLPVRVVDAEGNPAPGMNFETYLAAQCIGVDLATESTDTLDLPVPPGTQVRVFAGETRWYGHGAPAASADAVTVPRGDAPAEPVVLRLGPPGKLTIRLLDAEGHDVPLSRARLDFDGRMPERPAEGGWPLHPAESLVLDVEVPGFARRHVAVAPPHPPELELKVRLVPATRVVGRVVDAAGRPAPLMTKVRISVPADGDVHSVEEYALPDGRFEIDAPSGAAAELAVLDRDGMRRLRRPVRIEGTGTTDLGNVVLPRMAAVEGIVTDERGRGIGGTRIRFFDTEDDEDLASMLITGPDGRFRAPLPVRDGIRFFAIRAGYGAAFASFAPDGPRPVRIVLRPGGRVHVRFPDDKSMVRARLVGAEESWFPLGIEVPTDDEDEFTFDGFRPGEVELTIYRLGGELKTRVTVVAGETVEARF